MKEINFILKSSIAILLGIICVSYLFNVETDLILKFNVYYCVGALVVLILITSGIGSLFRGWSSEEHSIMEATRRTYISAYATYFIIMGLFVYTALNYGYIMNENPKIFILYTVVVVVSTVGTTHILNLMNSIRIPTFCTAEIVNKHVSKFTQSVWISVFIIQMLISTHKFYGEAVIIEDFLVRGSLLMFAAMWLELFLLLKSLSEVDAERAKSPEIIKLDNLLYALQQLRQKNFLSKCYSLINDKFFCVAFVILISAIHVITVQDFNSVQSQIILFIAIACVSVHFWTLYSASELFVNMYELQREYTTKLKFIGLWVCLNRIKPLAISIIACCVFLPAEYKLRTIACVLLVYVISSIFDYVFMKKINIDRLTQIYLESESTCEGSEVLTK